MDDDDIIYDSSEDYVENTDYDPMDYLWNLDDESPPDLDEDDLWDW